MRHCAAGPKLRPAAVASNSGNAGSMDAEWKAWLTAKEVARRSWAAQCSRMWSSSSGSPGDNHRRGAVDRGDGYRGVLLEHGQHVAFVGRYGDHRAAADRLASADHER